MRLDRARARHPTASRARRARPPLRQHLHTPGAGRPRAHHPAPARGVGVDAENVEGRRVASLEERAQRIDVGWMHGRTRQTS